jgi:hypothetical protein
MTTTTEIRQINLDVALARSSDFYVACPDWAVKALDSWHYDQTPRPLRQGTIDHVRSAIRCVNNVNVRLIKDLETPLSPEGYKGRKNRKKKVAV